MTLMRIRLELARSPEFPNGSGAHGYSFVAPLTADGHLDALDADVARGRVLEAGDHAHQRGLAAAGRPEDGKDGHLVHHGTSWRFHYEGEDMDEDEPLYKLDRHTIRAGEYLSITEQDEVLRTFRVTQVEPSK